MPKDSQRIFWPVNDDSHTLGSGSSSHQGLAVFSEKIRASSARSLLFRERSCRAKTDRKDSMIRSVAKRTHPSLMVTCFRNRGRAISLGGIRRRTARQFSSVCGDRTTVLLLASGESMSPGPVIRGLPDGVPVDGPCTSERLFCVSR